MAVGKNKKLNWLPPGWKVEDKVKNGRKVRHFINVKSARRLYSKAAVLRYIRNTRFNNRRSKLMNGLVRRSPRNKQIPEPNDSSEWLPPGWIMEVRTRKSGPKVGIKYKCFIDPSTGKSFYSKPEVSRYLKEAQQSSGSSGRKKNDTRGDSSVNVSVSRIRHHKPDPGQKVPQQPKPHEGKSQPSKKRKVTVETVIDEGLPAGWIKEIRIKKSSNGVRKDPFYFDPSSGYVFRSRLEVLRYLETGEISKHAYKRKDSDGNSLQSTEGRVPPSVSAVKTNAAESTTKKQRCAGKGSPEGSSRRGNSKVEKINGVSAGNSVLLAAAADLDGLIPMKPQEGEGNKNDTVQIYSDPASSSLKDIFPEKKPEGSNEVNIVGIHPGGSLVPMTWSTKIPEVHLYDLNEVMSGENEDISDMNKQVQPEACDTALVTNPTFIPSKDELLGAERLKDVEECGNRNSRNRERKSKRNRKEIVSSRRISKRLAGIEVESVTHSVAIERVLRSASRKSAKSEAITSLGSKQGVSTQETPQVIKVGSHEEFPAASSLPEDQETKEASRSRVGDETIKEPIRTIIVSQAIKDPSRSTIENQKMKEQSRIDVNEHLEQHPITDEQTTRSEINGREREQQDPQFCFPWSDPCIEFAFKTLTGAIPLDDNLAIHDYVQHQIRTSADNRNNITLPDDGPPGFCQNDIRRQFDASRQQQRTNSAVPRTQQSQHADVTLQKGSMFSPQNLICSNNVTLPDEGPPGFCENIIRLPFDTSKQQQRTNSAVPRTQQSQHADVTLQKGSIFSAQNLICRNDVTLPDDGPPGFSQNDIQLQFDAGRQQQRTNSVAHSTQLSQHTDVTLQKGGIFSPRSLIFSNNVTLPDDGPPGFCRNNVPLQFDAARQQQQINTAVPRTQQSQPANVTLQKGNIFSPQNLIFGSNVTLSDDGPPGFCQNNGQLSLDTTSWQQQTCTAAPHTQQSQTANVSFKQGNIFSPRNRN